jgi:hypothetical protein
MMWRKYHYAIQEELSHDGITIRATSLTDMKEITSSFTRTSED